MYNAFVLFIKRIPKEKVLFFAAEKIQRYCWFLRRQVSRSVSLLGGQCECGSRIRRPRHILFFLSIPVNWHYCASTVVMSGGEMRQWLVHISLALGPHSSITNSTFEYSLASSLNQHCTSASLVSFDSRIPKRVTAKWGGKTNWMEQKQRQGEEENDRWGMVLFPSLMLRSKQSTSLCSSLEVFI